MKCIKDLRKSKSTCQNKKCRHWIDYTKDLNCVFETIKNNDDDEMTLREISKRLGVSFVRVKQIEDIALAKICLKNPQLFEYLLKDDF